MRFVRRGALVAYCLGMTGHQDRAARAQARLDAIYERLDLMIDLALDALDAVELKAGDALAVQRYVRGVDLTGKAAKTLAGLMSGPVRGGPSEQTEDEMNHRDDSPETLDRLRAELESRLAQLDAVFEQKGLFVEPGCWPRARSGGEPVQRAGASAAHGDRLADLGDAGRTRVGKDLCGGLVDQQSGCGEWSPDRPGGTDAARCA